MTITISYLSERFDKYNNLYFGGKLRKPTFRIKHTKCALGSFSPMDFKIEISDYYIRESKDYDNTLIHEMIHLYQCQFKTEDRSHGKVFKRECARINRYGWSLSRVDHKRYDINPKYNRLANMVRKTSTTYNVCYYYCETNNKYFIFVICDSNLERYRDYFKKSNIKATFVKSRNSYFESFPKCRSRVRGYYKTIFEINQLLNE